MNALKAIRAKLGVTQAEVADALSVSQGNVSFYENGQNIPSDVARALIAFAKERGLLIGFDHVYGDLELPELIKSKRSKTEA